MRPVRLSSVLVALIAMTGCHLLLGVPLIMMRNTWVCDVCRHSWRPD